MKPTGHTEFKKGRIDVGANDKTNAISSLCLLSHYALLQSGLCQPALLTTEVYSFIHIKNTTKRMEGKKK